MRRWRVLVDDPDQARAHEFEVLAMSAPTALIGAARRALVADRFGIGQQFGRFSLRQRVRDCLRAELVRAVARNARVIG